MSTIESAREVALTMEGAHEQQTWGRATFRVGRNIFAALHEDLLILRGDVETQADRLAQDPRLIRAPYWGRYGWVAVPIASISDEELGELVRSARELLPQE